MLDYLREESNPLPRLGAVGIGGLTGLVFSLRGGKFKRLVYTSTGALSVAAVCYPKQAQDSFTAIKHYANIGYNFIYGGKSKLKGRIKKQCACSFIFTTTMLTISLCNPLKTVLMCYSEGPCVKELEARPDPKF